MDHFLSSKKEKKERKKERKKEIARLTIIYSLTPHFLLA